MMYDIEDDKQDTYLELAPPNLDSNQRQLRKSKVRTVSVKKDRGRERLVSNNLQMITRFAP